MSEGERPVLEVRGVTFGYGRQKVLDDIDLAVYPRDYLAIIGPNGGGKTTLVKVMLGLVEPWSGEVVYRLVEGEGRRPRLGYVPQFSTFDRGFPLAVRDVVLMGRAGSRGLVRRYTAADRARVAATLARLKLTPLARTHLSELSGGQLQRVLIARALVGEPDILFLDEPTASIDAESRRALEEVLDELNREIPLVLVTHDVTAVVPVVRHIACVNRRLHYHGSPEITADILEETYGCPVEMIAHGVPHRVLERHG